MKRLLLIIAFIANLHNVFAYGFSAIVPTGQTLYFNIVEGNAQVTCPVSNTSSSYVWDGYVKPSGNLIIPDSISYSGHLYAVTSIGENAFAGCDGLTLVTIPNTITSIGHGAFCYCSGLSSITIPNSVTSIGTYAFCYCRGLTILNFYADSCVSIVNNANYRVFYGCDSLSTINIGNNVIRIPDYLCYGCGALTSVTIPNSVIDIGQSAFMNCRGLTTVFFKADNCVNGANAFSGCNNLANIYFDDSVTSIPNGLCSSCSRLTYISIPTSVSTIGNGAFSGCSGLTTLTIPDFVVSVGSSAFCNCLGLTALTIGNSVSEIGDSAFLNCSELTSLTIPNSVTHIGDLAFSQCNELETVYFNAMNCSNAGGSVSKRAFYNCNNISTINIGDSVTTIPSFLGYGCSGMSSVAIPNAVTSIGSSAFQGCIGLTSINIPNSTNKIGVSAFQGCDHITNITLGTGVDTIKDSAFRGCTQVVRMTSKSMTPPTVYINTFNGLSDDVILDVPCDAANAYENAAYWFRFNIQEDLVYDFSATSSNPARGTVTIVTEPTCDYREAQVQANAYHGYHFDHWSDGNTDNPRYIVVLQDTHLVAFFASDNGEDEDVEEVVENRVKCYQQSGQIVVEGTEGNNVMVYDLYGRVLATKRNEGSLLWFDVPATGTYLIRIGDAPARRVVVIR